MIIGPLLGLASFFGGRMATGWVRQTTTDGIGWIMPAAAALVGMMPGLGIPLALGLGILSAYGMGPGSGEVVAALSSEEDRPRLTLVDETAVKV